MEAICSKFGKLDKNKIRCFRVKTTVLFMIIVVPKTINLLTKFVKSILGWGYKRVLVCVPCSSSAGVI